MPVPTKKTISEKLADLLEMARDIDSDIGRAPSCDNWPDDLASIDEVVGEFIDRLDDVLTVDDLQGRN